MKTVVKGFGGALLAIAFLYVLLQGYKGVVWIREAHAKAHVSFNYLAEPVAKTEDGRTVLRGDILNKLIADEVSRSRK